MEGTKRCPYCGEEILAVAKKCKHCGEWLNREAPVKEKNACPACGELIDADLEVCPHCKETTHFQDETKRISTFQENSQRNRVVENAQTQLLSWISMAIVFIKYFLIGAGLFAVIYEILT